MKTLGAGYARAARALVKGSVSPAAVTIHGGGSGANVAAWLAADGAEVVFVGRPVFGQQDSTVQLFKLEADGKFANKVKVVLGRSSVNTIEIKDGLKVGDQVILSDMSAYDSYDRIKLN